MRCLRREKDGETPVVACGAMSSGYEWESGGLGDGDGDGDGCDYLLLTTPLEGTRKAATEARELMRRLNERRICERVPTIGWLCRMLVSGKGNVRKSTP